MDSRTSFGASRRQRGRDGEVDTTELPPEEGDELEVLHEDLTSGWLID